MLTFIAQGIGDDVAFVRVRSTSARREAVGDAYSQPFSVNSSNRRTWSYSLHHRRWGLGELEVHYPEPMVWHMLSSPF